LIIGVSADKDIPAIFAALLPIAGRVIVTRARNVRAADIETLAAQAADGGQEPLVAASVNAALDLALNDQQPIIVTGSLFTVADAREAWFRRSGIPIDHD
jgi:folylpolyglutamate synthase/dihydropteroate synthase